MMMMCNLHDRIGSPSFLSFLYFWPAAILFIIELLIVGLRVPG